MRSLARWTRGAGGRALVLPVLVVALVLPACGGAADGDADDASGATNPAAETSDAAGDGAPDGAPSVVFAGDSVMQELSGGLIEALEGQADASYVGMPTVAGNDAVLEEWTERLQGDAPDLVVVQLGVWEANAAPYVPYGMIGYGDSLDPLVSLLSEHTQVLWLGHPALQEPDGDQVLDQMIATWEALPERHPNVEFLDSGAAVEVDGEFRTLYPLPDGREVLVRQTDGRHLCPDGVVLVGRAVLAELAERLPLEVDAGWESGAWRTDPELFGDLRFCPPELGEPLLP